MNVLFKYGKQQYETKYWTLLKGSIIFRDTLEPDPRLNGKRLNYFLPAAMQLIDTDMQQQQNGQSFSIITETETIGQWVSPWLATEQVPEQTKQWINQ